MVDLAIHLGFGAASGGREYGVGAHPKHRWTKANIFTEIHDFAIREEHAQWLLAQANAAAVGHSNDADALWLVLTNAVAGQDAAFNDWYDHRHVHDALAIAGFHSARRFRLLTVAEIAPSYNYLAVFGIDPVNLDKTIAEAVNRAGTALMPNPGYLAPGALTLTLRPLA